MIVKLNQSKVALKYCPFFFFSSTSNPKWNINKYIFNSSCDSSEPMSFSETEECFHDNSNDEVKFKTLGHLMLSVCPSLHDNKDVVQAFQYLWKVKMYHQI